MTTTVMEERPAQAAGPGTPLHGVAVAFLCSRYPAISHTFVLREVMGLRALGLRIITASINEPDRPITQLTAEERDEAANTLFIKAAGWRGALQAHLAVLFTSPRGYWRGLWRAIAESPAGAKALAYQLFYFTEALIAGQWMKRERVAHIHVHFGTPAASVGLLVAATFGFGFSLTIHGPDEFYNVNAHRLRSKFSAARFICTIGQFARSQVIRLLPPDHWNKVRVTPLGIVPEHFTPSSPDRGHQRIRVLCVGRLVPEKGQRILIDAAAHLARNGWPLEVHLVGDGPSREALMAEVERLGLSGQILFHGAQSPDRIAAFLRQADIFVLASFAEGIPVSLMEAMAMEVPCVSTFVNGIPELIESGVDGLLTAPGDASSLAEAIARLAADEELRRAMGRAARRKVLARYNLPVNHRRLAGVFAEHFLAAPRA